jgi:hypothetical protein
MHEMITTLLAKNNQHCEGFARHVVQNTMELIGKHVER